MTDPAREKAVAEVQYAVADFLEELIDGTGFTVNADRCLDDLIERMATRPTVILDQEVKKQRFAWAIGELKEAARRIRTKADGHMWQSVADDFMGGV